MHEPEPNVGDAHDTVTLVAPYRSGRAGKRFHIVNTAITIPPFNALCGHAVVFAKASALLATVTTEPDQCANCRDAYEYRQTDGYLPPLAERPRR